MFVGSYYSEGHRGRDSIFFGFTTTCVICAYITTKVVSSNATHDEIQLHVIKFVSDLLIIVNLMLLENLTCHFFF